MSSWPALAADDARPGAVPVQRALPAVAQREPRAVAADGKPAAVARAGGQPPRAQAADGKPKAVVKAGGQPPRAQAADGKPKAVVKAGG
jgi:hypothetical protein